MRLKTNNIFYLFFSFFTFLALYTRLAESLNFGPAEARGFSRVTPTGELDFGLRYEEFISIACSPKVDSFVALYVVAEAIYPLKKLITRNLTDERLSDTVAEIFSSHLPVVVSNPKEQLTYLINMCPLLETTIRSRPVDFEGWMRTQHPNPREWKELTDLSPNELRWLYDSIMRLPSIETLYFQLADRYPDKRLLCENGLDFYKDPCNLALGVATSTLVQYNAAKKISVQNEKNGDEDMDNEETLTLSVRRP